MADVVSPVEVLTPSKGGLKNFWNILLWIFGFGALFALIYWLLFLKGVSWTVIKQLIATESANYPDASKIELEHIILQGCKEIVYSPTEMMQVKEFAKFSNLPIEQVIVDNAIAEAKLRKYVA